MEDDSGAYAVFAEQGSSASQMTAAKAMDVIARLPDCDGQAAEAVPAYAQVKMEDAPRLLKIPKSVQTNGYAFQDTSGGNHDPEKKIQLFLLKGFFRSSFGRTVEVNGNSRKLCWSSVGRNYRTRVSRFLDTSSTT